MDKVRAPILSYNMDPSESCINMCTDGYSARPISAARVHPIPRLGPRVSQRAGPTPRPTVSFSSQKTPTDKPNQREICSSAVFPLKPNPPPPSSLLSASPQAVGRWTPSSAAPPSSSGKLPHGLPPFVPPRLRSVDSCFAGLDPRTRARGSRPPARIVPVSRAFSIDFVVSPPLVLQL
jgi:hypothetical protein